MFPESKVTEIYCMADDFCKEFTLQQEKYMIEDKKTRHRNKPNRMNDAEIMVILILFHSGGFRCFKHYYKEYVCKHLKHLFPRQVSYNRFVELEKEVLLPMTIFIKKVLLGTCTGISFVDSTPLRVCRNQRILIHKTFGNHTIFRLDTHRNLTYLCAVTFKNNDYGKSYYVCQQ